MGQLERQDNFYYLFSWMWKHLEW